MAKQEGKMDMQAMMEIYRKVGTPGAPHKLFANLEGSWTTRTKSWAGPDQPPMDSTGTCEQKLLLGGRYLQQEYTGDMMGETVHGINIVGYNNHTKKYVVDLDRLHEHGHLLLRGNSERRRQDAYAGKQL